MVKISRNVAWDQLIENHIGRISELGDLQNNQRYEILGGAYDYLLPEMVEFAEAEKVFLEEFEKLPPQ